MQRIYIALALALTFSCAFGSWNVLNNAFVKPPAPVVNDNDTNFTNILTAQLGLAVTNAGELSLVNQNMTLNTANSSANNWVVWIKKVDAKTLAGGANNSIAFTFPMGLGFGNGYAIAVVAENETSVTALRVYQYPINGGAALARLTLTTTNNTMPMVHSAVQIGKTAYVIYWVGGQRVNFTSFTIGGSVGSNEYILTSTLDNLTFVQAVWGEALGSSSFLAYWTEGGNPKDAVVDASKGTVPTNGVSGVVAGQSCRVYSTDKKWYGEFCYATVTDNGTTTFRTYVRTNTSGIVQLSTYNATTTSYFSHEPYGPYLAVFFSNPTNATFPVYSREIWNLDTLTLATTPVGNRTDYLSVDGNSAFAQVRVPAGGIYALLYNSRQLVNGTLGPLSNVNVGLVMGSSYLASVLGFFMTIAAGLFLF